ncbi:hypothetical protein BH24ACT5_BH24ACT5_00050 [soil metagenome]
MSGGHTERRSRDSSLDQRFGQLPIESIGHLKTLDGLRGIAILAVVAVHLYSPIFGGGGWGVDLFFVLSGFLITKLAYEEYSRTNHFALKDFYLRRLFRLQPAAIVFLVVMFWSSFTILSESGFHIRRQIAFAAALSGNLYALFYGDAPRPALGHTWSLGLEEQFYFAWPFLLVLPLGAAFVRPRRFLRIVAVTTAASVLIGRIVVAGIVGYPHWASIPLFNIDGLAMGCLLAIFLHTATGNLPAWRPWLVWSCVVVVTLALFVGGAIHDVDSYGLQRVVLRVVFTYCMLVAIVHSSRRPVVYLEHRLLRYFGRISYSWYLWHLPVFFYFEAAQYEGWNRVARAVVQVSISIVLANASNVFIERPVLSAYRRRRRERSTVPALTAVAG